MPKELMRDSSCLRELALREMAPAFRHERHRLADVVETRPHELAGHETVLLHQRELHVRRVRVIGRIVVVGTDACRRRVIVLLGGHREVVEVTAGAVGGGGFAVNNREVGPPLARNGVAPGVVPAGDIQRGGELGLRRLRHALRQADRARRVERLDETDHRLQQAGRVGILEPFQIPDFIADAPDHDAGMVAVAADEVGVLLLAVFGDRDALGQRGRAVPFVEGLVPDHDAHAVAQVEQLGRGRVVAGADGVHPHVLHDLQFALHRAGVERHAQRAEVGMQADPVQLHAPAVEMETVVGRELERADAERRFGRVHELAGDKHACDGGVEPRRFDVPKLGFAQGDRRHARLRTIGRHGEAHPQLGDLFALRIEQRGFHFRLDGRGGVVFQRGFHPDRGRVAGDLGRRHECPPLRDMHGLVHDELHLAIDARARIPARVVLARVHVDGHDVGLPGLHEIRRVHAERHVAVIPAAGLLAVDIHRRHRHHAVEVEIHALAGIGGRQA